MCQKMKTQTRLIHGTARTDYRPRQIPDWHHPGRPLDGSPDWQSHVSCLGKEESPGKDRLDVAHPAESVFLGSEGIHHIDI